MRNLALIFSLSFSIVLICQESIKVATWNLEHLGITNNSNKKVRGGMAGCHSKKFPMRTSAQLDSIALLIQERDLDVIALQEIHQYNGDCKQLSKIKKKLGNDWKYEVSEMKSNHDGFSTGMSKMQTAFLWNSKKVKLDTIFNIYFPEKEVQSSDLHDRPPLVAKFTCLKNDQKMNDFVLVNLHLASGQSKRRNKAIAMVQIVTKVETMLLSSDYWLENTSSKKVEDDVIFLGDFNHDPWDVNDDKLHSFMTKGFTINDYRNLLNKDESCTRMNTRFSSRIDHIYVSEGVEEYLEYDYAKLWKPDGPEDCNNWGEWRKSFSDHFPLYFKIKILPDN